MQKTCPSKGTYDWTIAQELNGETFTRRDIVESGGCRIATPCTLSQNMPAVQHRHSVDISCKRMQWRPPSQCQDIEPVAIQFISPIGTWTPDWGLSRNPKRSHSFLPLTASRSRLGLALSYIKAIPQGQRKLQGEERILVLFADSNQASWSTIPPLKQQCCARASSSLRLEPQCWQDCILFHEARVDRLLSIENCFQPKA